MTFDEHLAHAATQGTTNLLFERGMYLIAEEIGNMLRIFERAQVPFEVIGGVAAKAHPIAAKEDDRSFLTRDIDILLRRPDLAAAAEAAELLGYRARKIAPELRLRLQQARTQFEPDLEED